MVASHTMADLMLAELSETRVRAGSRGTTMHVISRRENEGIVIDNRFIVTVLEFDDDHVRLAVETPDEEPYYREEVITLEPEYA